MSGLENKSHGLLTSSNHIGYAQLSEDSSGKHVHVKYTPVNPTFI